MKSIPISFITLNAINKHPLHAIKMHILTHMKWSHIQAYKGNMNVYGPLWTLSSVWHVPYGHISLNLLYVFPLFLFP